MLLQLLLAGCVIGITVVNQAMFMSIGLRMLKYLERRGHPILKRPNLLVVVWVSFLLVPISIDVVLWAWLYRLRNALPNFEEALYFSTVTFTTVGYGDIVLDRESRLLATFEAANGWIIFGWATALMMIVIQRLYLPERPR
ncbi:potassium channel family protein [Mesorhizobium marinum]|uniref:potassium channel family protein n=1 Tax=Mesorhizobium marinum TaxID=3228790 RepID=UPI0034659C2E